MTAVDIVMPRLSDSMEEGTVLKWLKAVGDQVERGEDLVEIETDKANMTYASDTAGILVEVIAHEGDVRPVGEVIARIDPDSKAGKTPSAEPDKEKRGETEAPPASKPSTAETAPSPVKQKIAPSGEKRIKASPVARRLAGESGIDIAKLTGTGPGGRVVKADVEAATDESTKSGREMGEPPVSTIESSIPGEELTSKGKPKIVELDRPQRAVARRMAESKAVAPHFYLQSEIDMKAAVELREQLKKVSSDEVIPTYNDMVVRATAIALHEHPRANGSYRDGKIELYSRVNVGIAVAGDANLVVPTVFDADKKSLGEIAHESRNLAEKVRSQTITPPELSGGTFTVSNLGMFGIKNFAAVINPPQAAILSIGEISKRAVIEGAGDAIAIRPTMEVTLSCDHRILYGAEGAQFLARIKEILEEPLALTL